MRIAVGDQNLELDPEKLRALANDLWRHAEMGVIPEHRAAAEAMIAAGAELKRLADGVEALNTANEQMIQAAMALAVQTVVEVFQPAECQCAGCIERRAREAKGELCNCANCKARREAQARRMN